MDREECLTSSRNQSEVSKNGIDLLLVSRTISYKPFTYLLDFSIIA